MQQHWAHFLAISAAFLAISVIVAAAQYSHSSAASRIYAAVQRAHHDGSTPDKFFASDLTTGLAATNSGVLMGIGREGSRWANNAHNEATIWSLLLLGLLVLILAYHYWYSQK